MSEENETAQELLKSIRDKLSDLEDMQLVNKLDIINMKNELDRVSLTSAPSPETTEKIAELAKMAEKSDKLKKLESAYSDIEKMKSDLEKAKPADSQSVRAEMDMVKKKLSELESGAKPGELPPAGSDEIKKMKKEIGNIKSQLESRGGEGEVPGDLQERLDAIEKSLSAARAAKPSGIDSKQLQEILERIEKVESRKPSAGRKVTSPDVKAEIAAIGERIAELEKRKTPAPVQPRIAPKQIQELIARMEGLESRKPVKVVRGVPPATKAEIQALEEKVAKLEKKRPRAPAPKVPDNVLAELKAKAKDIQNISAKTDSIRSLLDEQKAKISRLESEKKKPGAPAPPDILKRLDGMEVSLERFDLLKSELVKEQREISELKREINVIGAMRRQPPGGDLGKRVSGIENKISKLLEDAKKKPAKPAPAPAPGPSIEEVENMLESVKSSVEEQGKEILDLHDNQQKKVEENAKKIEQLGKTLQGAAKPGFEEDLEELRKDVQILNASIPKGMPPQGKAGATPKDIDDIKAKIKELEKGVAEKKTGDGVAARIESVSNEITTLKTKIGEMEKKATTGVAMSPETLTELKKLKGQFPVEEFTTLKNRMTELENSLAKTSKLAAALKPIELPGKAGDASKVPTDLDEKIKSLEKIMGEGVNPARVQALESRLDELKSRLPEQIGKGTEKKLNDLKEEMEGKLAEMDNLKRDLVESTIEELLAQPDNVSKLMDEKLAKEIKDIRERVAKMDQKAGPSDAKLTTLLKESDEREKELEKIKESLHDIESRSGKDLESLEIELKALTSKLSSTTTSVKGMEGAGVTDITRDLEILKTKAEWLESTVQKFDLKPIYEKIEELEDRLRTHGGYSPMVIE
jgi:hypothetical protein